ncbi:MAG: type II toxin-antitoxin system Phd/YefM family antitoxin [Roseateles sp.]|uniref:type II toxin-antitoxin system Phd/YefM family antitoxin n=1 Tax=Roseateles sp. TaxID=1971397 RepID=UPI00403533E6
MSQHNIAEAKAQFSDLVQRALAGEDIVIAKDNRPLLRLVPLDSARGPRQPGSARGSRVLKMADDFDAPLDDFAAYR